jgi:hypothetical protein
MGGSSPKPQTTTQTTSSAPWGAQQPYLKEGFEEAQRLYEGPKPQYFPGSTVVPYSPETEAAFGTKLGQVRDPGSLINLAGAETGRTLRGEYLQADNPVYQEMLRGVTSAVRPGVDTDYARGGRFGSPLHTEALGRGISAGMMPYIGAERARQQGAVGAALPVSQYGAGLLAGVGGAREAKGREFLQEDIDRFNFEQMREPAKLREYMGAISPEYGSETTRETTQPLYSSGGLSALGGAMGGAQIGSMFGPWGAGIGGAAGGVGGLLAGK